MRTVPYLNLGCGVHFDPSWVNLDFTKTGEGVIPYDLTKGIPFSDESFEVVYHSHVLEHFTKNKGDFFISECYRVLKRNGIIRIAVPDLASIIDTYVEIRNKLLTNPDDRYLNECYDWILTELFDQIMRNKSGGNMLEFLKRSDLINRDFIVQRCGNEVEAIMTPVNNQADNNLIEQVPYKPSLFTRIKNLPFTIKKKWLKILLGDKFEALEIGTFRISGENHYWMYDEFSLARLLNKHGFISIKKCSVDESRIPLWNSYQLEKVNGVIRKPDSLFVEANKI